MNMDRLLKEHSGIRLDIGCGAAKQSGFVGMDVRPLDGVDIVWDVRRMPWPLPDESVVQAMSSHLVEHISPDPGDHRVELLVNLLMSKGLVTATEIKAEIGEIESKPRFVRFMDEVWRVLKVGAQFIISCPHQFSMGFGQDPTHCNAINERTWAYFDPFEQRYSDGLLWRIYRPKPWKLEGFGMIDYATNIEVALTKRALAEVENV